MPNAVMHPSAKELSAFSQGKLADAASAAVARHLETCPACRKAIDNLPGVSLVGKVRAAKPDVFSLPARAGNAANAAAPSAPKNLPPDLANYAKYRFLRELGRGGMGVVYQAEQTVMGRMVAVKVINPCVLDHPDALPRFQGEVKAAAKLDHPNIVRAYDAEQVGSMHLLVMEYVEGTSLAELVKKKGPQPVAYACHYIRQAALGLQHAFEQGMVHRDIKPQNLMVNPRGQVKVLDFGLARMFSERKQGCGLTQADTFMGTPEYVAPEQATDARSADTRADIYSLGCTLFFVLTGRPPFQGDTLVELVLAQIEKEPPVLRDVRADVPAELSALVARMLAKDPGRRFQTPIEVEQALAAFVKPGTKRSAVGGSSSPPGTGTMIAANISKIKAILRDAPGKTSALDVPANDTAASAFAGLGEALVSARKAKPARKKWWIAGGVAMGLLGLGALVVLRVETSNGTLLVELNDAEVEARIKNGKLILSGPDGKVRYTLTAKERSNKLEAGPYKIHVEGADGLVLDTPEFMIEKGGQVKVRVTLKSTGGAKKEPPNLDPDRKAAEWVLSRWGAVRVSVRGAEKLIESGMSLRASYVCPWDTLATLLDGETPKSSKGNNIRRMSWWDHTGSVEWLSYRTTNPRRLWESSVYWFDDSGIGVCRPPAEWRLLWLDGDAWKPVKMLQGEHYGTRLDQFNKVLFEPVTTRELRLEVKLKPNFSGGVLKWRLMGEKALGPAERLPAEKFAVLEINLNGKQVGESGLAHLAALNKLRRLDLAFAVQVTDAGLIHLKGLTNLRVLVLNGTGVSDVTLTHLKGLTNLRELHLWLNPVTDDGLANFNKLTNLENLDLNGTRVTDAGLIHLKSLTKLKLLNLMQTHITGAGLGHIKDLTNLQVLDFWGSTMGDIGLVNLKGLNKLVSLRLGYTRVSGADLIHLKGLSNLTWLYLPGLNVSDADLLQLHDLKKLQYLDLTKTKVTNAGVAATRKALPRCRIVSDAGNTTDPQ